MIDVVVIDNENTVARFIEEGIAQVTVYDDEIVALNAIEKSKPSIIFVNYKISPKAIKELIAILFKASMQSHIVLVGSQLSDDDILDCLASGSKSYLQINEVEAFINKLITVVTGGEAWVSRRLVAKLIDRLHRQQPLTASIQKP